jgi:hypothetical protein
LPVEVLYDVLMLGVEALVLAVGPGDLDNQIRSVLKDVAEGTVPQKLANVEVTDEHAVPS